MKTSAYHFFERKSWQLFRLFAVLVMAMTCQSISANDGWGTRIIDGVKYVMYGDNSACIKEILPDNGPIVRIRETADFYKHPDSKIVKFETVHLSTSIYYSDNTVYTPPTLEGIEHLILPKYFTYPEETLSIESSYHSTTNYTYETDLKLCPDLKRIDVDPQNKNIASHKGMLYISSEDNKYDKLAVWPLKSEVKDKNAIHPQTKSIVPYALCNLDMLDSLIIPKSVKFVNTNWNECAIRNNKNLKYLEIKGKPRSLSYEGWYYDDTSYPLHIGRLPNLRHLVLGEEGVDSVFVEYYEREVKMTLAKSIKYVSGYLSNGLFIDLPNICKIGYSIGKVQALRIGNKIDLEAGIPSQWMDRNKVEHFHLCLLSSVPPSIYKATDNDLKPHPNWTLYVPEEALEAYREHPYWGTSGRILPIDDILVPVISDRKLEIEQYETNDYRWDVMPLGNAVARESGRWESSDPNVATIDDEGLLRAVGIGQATITFTIEDTDGNEYTATSDVTVSINTSGIDETLAEENPTAQSTNSKTIPDGVYDLHGRRIADTTSSDLTPGLYIVRQNGLTSKTVVR